MNETLFLYINSFAGNNHILDLFFMISAKAMPYIFIGIEVWLYFIAKRKKEAIFAFYSVLVGLFISQIIGIFYFHNRPFMDNIGHSIGFHIAENSFPSDHTTFIFSIAFSIEVNGQSTGGIKTLPIVFITPTFIPFLSSKIKWPFPGLIGE